MQYLKKVEKCASKADALKVLASTASSLTLPGEAAWPLGSIITAPKTAVETGASPDLAAGAYADAATPIPCTTLSCRAVCCPLSISHL